LKFQLLSCVCGKQQIGLNSAATTDATKVQKRSWSAFRKGRPALGSAVADAPPQIELAAWAPCGSQNCELFPLSPSRSIRASLKGSKEVLLSFPGTASKPTRLRNPGVDSNRTSYEGCHSSSLGIEMSVRYGTTRARRRSTARGCEASWTLRLGWMPDGRLGATLFTYHCSSRRPHEHQSLGQQGSGGPGWRALDWRPG
jgi:hypothetical protein